MTASLKLDLPSKQILRELGGKRTKSKIFSATRKAGTSASRKMKTEVSRQIRARKQVKVAQVNKRIKVLAPIGPTDIDNLSWKITVDGSSIPVGSFKMRQLKRGVKFKANKGTWSTYEGSFIAKMRSGHVGAFRRASPIKSPRKKYKSRSGKTNTTHTPIKEIHTSGMASVFRHGASVDAVQGVGEKEFSSTFARLIKAGVK